MNPCFFVELMIHWNCVRMFYDLTEFFISILVELIFIKFSKAIDIKKVAVENAEDKHWIVKGIHDNTRFLDSI